MGGKVFRSGLSPLHTPRMPPEIYYAVKDRCHRALGHLYEVVSSPVEGPAKEEFGDIDICVALKKGTAGAKDEDARITIQHAIGAEFARLETRTSYFAIPWPEDLAPATEDGENQLSTQSKRYIQVDVDIFDSIEKLEWALFREAHGDIWSILGSIIRPYGLTVSDGFLFIRIPEIEHENRKRARVVLTQKPSEVLDFIGLPADEKFWNESFTSREALYEFVARCRMFYVEPPADEIDDEDGRDAKSPPVDGEADVLPSYPDEKGKQLKHDDRRRLLTRPLFCGFLDDFVARCRKQGRFSERRTSRDVIRDEAFARFGVKEEYEKRLDDFLREKQALYVKNQVIKASFPAPFTGPDGMTPTAAQFQYRGSLVKALTKIVMEDDVSFGVVPDNNSPVKDENGFYIIENVYDFINRHHEEVGKKAMERHNANFAELMQQKRLAEETGDTTD